MIIFLIDLFSIIITMMLELLFFYDKLYHCLVAVRDIIKEEPKKKRKDGEQKHGE